MSNYILRVLIALDQLVNTLIGGDPDETLSSAAYRSEKNGHFWGRVWRPTVDFLFSPFQKDHCFNAYLAEKYGAASFKGFDV